LSTTKLFGTDGIRGRAGEGWLTSEKTSAIGRAAGAVLARGAGPGARRALTGHDGRRSGPELEAALTRGLAASGYAVRSAGLVTTPALAFLARLFDYDMAAMLSASHNPAADNGIKIFGPRGEKLPDDVEGEIEARLATDAEPVHTGPAPKYDPSLENAYVDAVVDGMRSLDLAGVRIVLDCANGGGSHLAPRLFARLGATVLPLACSPDGDNINADCGATKPQAMCSEVVRQGAAIGIALDGDGDRCILADETGAEVSGDAILTICGGDLAERGALSSGRIVATVMSNRGLHRALRAKGVRVDTVGVGDRHVVEALRASAIELGGEQSGHIVFGSDHHYIGDGVYTALRVLDVMRRSGRALADLASPFQPFPQVLINAVVERKPPLSAFPLVQAAVEAIERELGDDGRVLLRYSGTESLARVMVEGPDEVWIREKATELAEIVVRAIASER
jgi:phosphoglucosamine mutase